MFGWNQRRKFRSRTSPAPRRAVTRAARERKPRAPLAAPPAPSFAVIPANGRSYLELEGVVDFDPYSAPQMSVVA